MSDRMENWKENLGKYPTELNELIGNSVVFIPVLTIAEPL
jgi:hypothetical protein